MPRDSIVAGNLRLMWRTMVPYGSIWYPKSAELKKSTGKTLTTLLLLSLTPSWENNEKRGKQYKDKSWIRHPNQSVTSATGFAAFTGLQRLQPEVPGPSPEAPGSKRDCTTWPMPSARNGTWMTCPESLRRVRDALSKSWWRKRMKPCYNSHSPCQLLGNIVAPASPAEMVSRFSSELSESSHPASRPQRRPCSSWSISPKTADKFNSVKASELNNTKQKHNSHVPWDCWKWSWNCRNITNVISSCCSQSFYLTLTT